MTATVWAPSTLPRKKRLRVALVGWGAIAQRVAGLLRGRNDDIVLIGVATRQVPKHDQDLPDGACWLAVPGVLRDLEPDLVVEAADRAAVEPWGLVSLSCASAFAVSSTSAFCDDVVLQRLVDVAERCGSQILIPSGALAGLDALAAAARLPLDSVTHRIIKPARAWNGTLAEGLVDLETLTQPKEFFRGSAREAASHFPANANVTAISALAGIGFDRTYVELVADPTITVNCHHLSARGDFSSLNVTVENRALATNPKSSELAALSLVRLIESRQQSIST
jgi:aspartate dehydrogenase